MVSGIKTMIKKEFQSESDDIIEKIFHKNAEELFFSPKSITNPPKNNKLAALIAAGALAITGAVLWKQNLDKDKDEQKKP